MNTYFNFSLWRIGISVDVIIMQPYHFDAYRTYRNSISVDLKYYGKEDSDE
ncbi:MAG: hypothetical protein MJZ36_10225 [Bacteroidaceae bacterium]|nr:hypothetical protein [Bacteroidaceae bacterium]